jgi:hypothetical protein
MLLSDAKRFFKSYPGSFTKAAQLEMVGQPSDHLFVAQAEPNKRQSEIGQFCDWDV